MGDRPVTIGHASGVSWGDFARFVDYTRSMTTFLPGSLAPTLAVLATVAEVTLGTALLLGIPLRLSALAAALLLGIYGTSMMILLPPAEQFHYNVFVLSAGMLAVATVHRSPLTHRLALSRVWPRKTTRQTRRNGLAGATFRLKVARSAAQHQPD